MQDVAAIAKGFKDPLGLMLDVLAKSMKKFFCEFLEHLWCFLDAFWRFLVDPGRLLLVFDGFDESLVLLFPGAVGRGKRCSPVPLVAACVVVPRVKPGEIT